jgi:hypothetical protein
MLSEHVQLTIRELAEVLACVEKEDQDSFACAPQSELTLRGWLISYVFGNERS